MKTKINNSSPEKTSETPASTLLDLSHEGVLCASNEYDIDGYEEKLFEW